MSRVVFDLDGTLIDSAPDIQAIANLVLTSEGRAPISLAEAKSFVGSGAPTFVARMRAVRDLPDSAQDRMLAAFVAHYDSAVGLTHPYPGVVTALETLKAQGHALGICTNKPAGPTRSVLYHLDLARFFDVVLGGDSMDRRKPDPAPLMAAFAALGEGSCLYVGDSEVDAETAERADVPFLLFTEGYRKAPIASLTHVAAFDRFDALPGLVSAESIASVA